MAITHLTDGVFADAIADGATLVDFWADWCGPCKMLAPTIEELAGEYGNVKFAKLDTDANGATAMTYNITAIPTVILFRDGKESERFVGVRPKEDYAAALAQV